MASRILAMRSTRALCLRGNIEHKKITYRCPLHCTLRTKKTLAIPLSTDYLVIGAGATGMAFVDELIHGSQDVKVVLVDKRAKPGGHWTDAYDFVKLHQPSAWYGVNSQQLGSGGADLTSKAQILAYYELVLEELQATGRLSYYPQCDYLGNGEFKSLVEEDVKYKVEVSKKIVDGTHLFTAVPSTTQPKYKVDEGVNLVPINGLFKVQRPWKKYVIIGAGKTGLDALLFLLDQKVDPDRIVWVVSNDCWYLNRDRIDINYLYEYTLSLFNPILEAKNINEVFQKYEDSGVFMRSEKNIWPTRLRGAIVSSREMEKFNTIKNIIRQGRIERIEQNSILFENGENLSTDTNTLHVDCSTASTAFPPAKKIWDGNTICIQLLILRQLPMSAATIAAMELKYPNNEEKKNAACCAINPPHFPWQFFQLSRNSNLNGGSIGQALGMGWMRNNRVSMLHHMSLVQFLKTMVYMRFYRGAINQKLELFSQQEHMYGKQV